MGCDDKIHCTDASDEKYEVCALWKCDASLWKCTINKCIDVTWVCDGDPPIEAYELGCTDGSDEDPDLCKDWNCTPGSQRQGAPGEAVFNLCSKYSSALSACNHILLQSLGLHFNMQFM